MAHFTKIRRIRRQRVFDIWLVRLSHIAQVGLFAITLGTIYFTVIPLYRTAVLEESVSRQQIALAQLTDKLDAAYVQLRSYVVDEYVRRSLMFCDPLVDFVMDDPTRGEGTSMAQSYRQKDVRGCLLSTLRQTQQINDLHSDDRDRLNFEIGKVGDWVEMEQQRTNAAYESFDARAQENSDALPEPGEFLNRMLDFLERKAALPPAEIEHQRQAARVQAGKDNLIKASVEEIRNRISSIGQISWPQATQVPN